MLTELCWGRAWLAQCCLLKLEARTNAAPKVWSWSPIQSVKIAYHHIFLIFNTGYDIMEASSPLRESWLPNAHGTKVTIYEVKQSPAANHSGEKNGSVFLDTHHLDSPTSRYTCHELWWSWGFTAQHKQQVWLGHNWCERLCQVNSSMNHICPQKKLLSVKHTKELIQLRGNSTWSIRPINRCF
jgi:hypothetical protein